MVLNLTESLRVTESSNRFSADSDCNEKRAAAFVQLFMKMLAVLL